MHAELKKYKTKLLIPNSIEFQRSIEEEDSAKLVTRHHRLGDFWNAVLLGSW